MDQDLLNKAFEASRQGQSYAFATIIEATLKGTPRKSGAKMLVFENGSASGSIGGGRNEKAATQECLNAIKTGKPTTVTYNYFGGKGQSVCGGQMKVFVEPFLRKKHFIICGAGHIALPLAMIAKMLNFKITIIDNRKAYANKKRFPFADKILVGAHAEILGQIPIDSNTYVMIVTQGNEYDFECLKAVVGSNAGYVGVISSKPKRIKFFKRLRESGIKETCLKKIKIPAGIDLGAQTPEEIAVSIAAELIAINNRSLVGTDKFKEREHQVK